MTARPRRSEHAQHGGDDDVELVVVDDVAGVGHAHQLRYVGVRGPVTLPVGPRPLDGVPVQWAVTFIAVPVVVAGLWQIASIVTTWPWARLVE